jgi:hypothetical protein
MTFRIAQTVVDGALDYMVDFTNWDSNLKLEIWEGTIPANCETASAGTKLATLTNTSGQLRFDVTPGSNIAVGKTDGGFFAQDTNPVATGTANYWRIRGQYGSAPCWAQGTISLAGGTGSLILDTLTITAGQTVTVTDFTITLSGVP